MYKRQKQDIPCARSRIFLLLQAGRSLCSKQDIRCVPSRTFRLLRTGHLFCSNHEKCTCHFLVNSADRPRIWANRDQICTIPGTIGQIRQKVARGFFSCFFARFFRNPCRKLRAERFAPKGSRRKVHAERFTPKGSRRKVHAAEFSERIVSERGHIMTRH